MTLPTRLAELRAQLNNNFLLGRKTSLALLDAVEAAVEYLNAKGELEHPAATCDEFDRKIYRLGIAKNTYNDALARLGGGE